MGQRVRKHKRTIACAATGTAFSGTIRESDQRAVRIVMELPNFTNGITVKLEVKDPDGTVLYDTGAKNENANYNFLVDIPFSGETLTLALTLSGAAGGTGGDVVLKIYAEEV